MQLQFPTRLGSPSGESWVNRNGQSYLGDSAVQNCAEAIDVSRLAERRSRRRQKRLPGLVRTRQQPADTLRKEQLAAQSVCKSAESGTRGTLPQRPRRQHFARHRWSARTMRFQCCSHRTFARRLPAAQHQPENRCTDTRHFLRRPSQQVSKIRIVLR